MSAFAGSRRGPVGSLPRAVRGLPLDPLADLLGHRLAKARASQCVKANALGQPRRVGWVHFQVLGYLSPGYACSDPATTSTYVK